MLSTKELLELERLVAKHPNDKELAYHYQGLFALVQDNPLYLFDPEGKHKKQRKFWAAGRVPRKMFMGGNQSGKTVGGIVDDLIQCCNEDALPEHLKQFKCWNPPFRCRVVVPSFKETLASFLEKLKQWTPQSQLVGNTWESAYKLKDTTLHFKNGSYIQFLSGDQEVKKHAAWTGDRVHFDEEPPGEHGRRLYVEAQQRVLVRKGQVMFTLTPDEGVTWSAEEVWERCEQGEPGYFGVGVFMDDNPALSKEEIERATKHLTHEEQQARRYGKPVYLKGRVYPEFDDTHIIDPPDPKDLKKLDVVVAIDPGLRVTAVTWTAFDKDEVAFVFDELYENEMTPESVVVLIHEKNSIWGLQEPMYVIDETANIRALANKQNVEDIYLREGLPVIRSQSDVDAGIFQVKRRLQQGGIFFSRSCKNTIKEMRRYRFHEVDTPSGKKVVPVKKNDHAIDSVRYACMERFWGPEPEIKKENRRKTTYNFVATNDEYHYEEALPMA